MSFETRLAALEAEVKELTSYTAYQNVKARLTALEMALGKLERTPQRTDEVVHYRVTLDVRFSETIATRGGAGRAIVAIRELLGEALTAFPDWSITAERANPIIGKDRPTCPRCSRTVGVCQQDGEWRCRLCEIAIGAVKDWNADDDEDGPA